MDAMIKSADWSVGTPDQVLVEASICGDTSAACQFAKMHGCRVIASASSDDKLAYLRNEVKVDYAFSYREGDPLNWLQSC
jgi:NADPH-dependent curcumin reductase CurA